ncbi:primosomal protein N' [uncultured Sunxiuqinia sp.]|uniref:replication restart helicase PriA n=1 Tax=uncultured Sunxiuqinia sp. TaxID=1573825 RepID=UPI0026346F0A|nr:primosomal protein N' [uncultured Sunxiuqinia sp.]
MSIPMFADLILPLPLRDKFTYRVSPGFEPNMKVGIRVVVQFGARKFFSALVYRLHNQPPEGDFELKEIDAILDREPIVNRAQIIAWEWVADYYCCSLGEVFKAALPSALKLESQSNVSFNPNFDLDSPLTGEEEALLLMLKGRGQTNIREINQFLGKKSSYATLKVLLEKNAILMEEKLKDSYKPKTVTFVQLAERIASSEQLEKAFEEIGRARKQKELLEFFVHETSFSFDQKSRLPKKDLLEQSGLSDAVLKGLVEKDILAVESIEIGRLEMNHTDDQYLYDLNEAQESSYRQLKDEFKTKRPVLLHGVTSSGKTEIYIKLIEDVLAEGKQVLYLVPEIGLTSQLITRLKRAFGDRAGIYHSKFNDAERVEIWFNILNDNKESYQVVIGARSAVFLPFKKLGLIVVDEEHENSYKQFDPAPRYNARDLAVVLGQIHQAPVLLGTATPSFESYFNAKLGKYGLVELKERFKGIELPEIVVSDIRKATRQKQMVSLLTPALYDEVKLALENKEQVILFQNRRGFAPYMQCTSCGWIPKCKNCDVSLTYHKFRAGLVCHYCGHTTSVPMHCEECPSDEIQTKGFGTEQIEEELNLLFPAATIARMDMDTTRARRAFDQLIYKFENRQIDLLVGTQMVTKGLDFDHVRVVGILNADQMLNFPDFRSFERSFQLMAQVSGRAGRKGKRGKVVIQSSQPEHEVLQKVAHNDFIQLFNKQMLERKLFRYPPYFRLIKIVVKHKNRDRLDLGANQLASILRNQFRNQVLGPEYPVIGRIQSWYQKEIWLKLDKNKTLGQGKKFLMDSIDQVKSLPNNTGLVIYADVDPM